MHLKMNRRDWMKTSATMGAGVWLGTSQTATARSAMEKLNVALVGIGGRGGDNLAGVAKTGVNIVALCDVDDARAGKAYEKFPQAHKFYDFRKMFDEMEQEIDAVVVSTPDHCHFHPSYRALEMGKHLYLEKPLAHNVWEVRTLTELAKKKKVATQLGAQRHALGNMHRVVELVQAGAIGQVTEVHSWIDGNRGMPGMPSDKPKVPDHLKWDLWLGPVAERAYHPTYAPYGWRFWWDFGTGETGNFGCHILDIPFWALNLKYPHRVSGSGPDVDAQMTPKSMSTKLEFAESDGQPKVDLYWYHASAGPEILREHNLSAKGNNTLFVGTAGMLLCGFGSHKLYPEEKFVGFKRPDKSIPDSPGFHQEWVNACQGGEPATCHFGYSGPLTEAVLLGNVAYRAQGTFDWDAQSLNTNGSERAQTLIREAYRKGWEI